jgi:hypothetical protein
MKVEATKLPLWDNLTILTSFSSYIEDRLIKILMKIN